MASTQRDALNALAGQISGAGPLTTAGTQGYLGLLGQGGSNQFSGLSAIGPLSELISTGSPADLSGLFKSSKDIAFRNIDDQTAALIEQFRSRGLGAGSDIIRGTGLIRERGTQDLNAEIIQASLAASEAAKGRQMGAIGLAQGLFTGAEQAGMAPILAGLGMQPQPTLPSQLTQTLQSITPLLAYLGAQRAATRTPSTSATSPSASPTSFHDLFGGIQQWPLYGSPGG